MLTKRKCKVRLKKKQILLNKKMTKCNLYKYFVLCIGTLSGVLIEYTVQE